jgi:hypothetical protein
MMTAFHRLILTCKTRFRTMVDSVTRAMDKPIDRTILSIALNFLKKTSVQANPGRKKTNMNPTIARMT